MGDPVTIMMAVGTGLSAVSTLAGGAAQRSAANEQARAAAFTASLRERQAQQLEQQAGQDRARSHLAAAEQRRQGRFVRSRAQAVAAASGAGALDPTIVNILGDLQAEEDFRAAGALAEGEDVARGLEFQAGLQRAGAQSDLQSAEAFKRAGRAAQRRSYMSAAGSLLEGGAGLYEKFATTPPPSEITFAPGFKPLRTGNKLTKYGYVDYG